MPNATAMGSLMAGALLALGATSPPTEMMVWLFIAAPALELPAVMGRALRSDGSFVTADSNITIQGVGGGTCHLSSLTITASLSPRYFLTMPLCMASPPVALQCR